MNTPLSIGIAGAGLVGRITALQLLRQGHRITLFEKDSVASENAAGLTAAGMLAPFAELETAESAIFATGLRSIELWPQLLQQIQLSDAFQREGSLITAHPADMPELDHFIAQLRAKVDAANEIQTLDRSGIVQLEPELTSHQKAFFLPTEAQVNAQAFMERSTAYLLTHPNVTWFNYQTVTHVNAHEITAEDKTHRFDWVFDTRGLGAHRLRLVIYAVCAVRSFGWMRPTYSSIAQSD